MYRGLFRDFLAYCVISLLVQEHTVLIIAALEYSSISVLVSSTYHSFSKFFWLLFSFVFLMWTLESLWLKKETHPVCVFKMRKTLREWPLYNVACFYPQFSSILSYLLPTEKMADRAGVYSCTRCVLNNPRMKAEKSCWPPSLGSELFSQVLSVHLHIRSVVKIAKSARHFSKYFRLFILLILTTNLSPIYS